MSGRRSEFDIIEAISRRVRRQRDDVAIGIGDDGAVLRVPEGFDLVTTTDSLVAEVHFPADLPAAVIGHRALAVNLSDLAAMGADPAWVELSLTLPEADPIWLEGFTSGFLSLAESQRVELVGGNVARGPLAITVHASGMVPRGTALLRSGARAGDQIWVSGTLGDAAAGLACLQGRLQTDDAARTYLVERFQRPVARVALGRALRGRASACIDVSDGLAADLEHMLAASGVGASIDLECLPLSQALLSRLDTEARLRLALAGGDDYELCFTVPADAAAAVGSIAADCRLTSIGRIEAERGLRLLSADGSHLPIQIRGYRHF